MQEGNKRNANTLDKSIEIKAINYSEADYAGTISSLIACKVPFSYVNRNPEGYGSLAEVINRAMSEATADLVWVITNITFTPNIPEALARNIGDAHIIHPAFKSDHPHMNIGSQVQQVPFVEFTAAMIDRKAFMGLDENMPYIGHDLDYGYRCHKAELKILVDYELRIGHQYIRKAKFHPIREKRKEMRKRANEPTKRALIAKYGEEWAGIDWFKSEKEIGYFYNSVIAKKFKR